MLFDAKKISAFSLIEILITLAMVGVLVSIAYPSLQSSMQQSRRIDATTGLLKIQYLQEVYRGQHTQYGLMEELKVATNPYYLFELQLITNKDNYLVTATPINSQQGDSCSIFALNKLGPVYKGYAPANCWQQ